MYVDSEIKFADDETLAGAVDTLVAFSGSTDLKRAGEDIGNGQPMYLVAVVRSGTLDAAVDIELVSGTDAAFTGLVSHAKIGQLASGATAGDSICGPIPATYGSSQEIQQFVGGGFTARGGAVSTGNVDVFLTTTPQKYKAYPKSYTIS